MKKGRAASARRFLFAMMTTGALPDPNQVRNSTYQGSMFGVHVDCTMYELPPHQWADVALTGGIFGSVGIAGKAWHEFDDPANPHTPSIRMDRTLQKTLRRYHVQLIDVYPAESSADGLMLDLSLPMVGKQRMMLRRVPTRPHDRWCEL